VNDALDGDGPWATPKSGSNAAKVKQIADFITHGNHLAADRLFAEIDHSTIEENDVRSELLYQEGRRASIKGDHLTAYEWFRKAAALMPNSSRYFAAEMESAVLARRSREVTLPQDLLDRLPTFDKDPEVAFQLARLRALEGNHEAADRILSTLEGTNRHKATALCAMIRGDWQIVLKAADKGLAEELDPRQEQFLKLLRLRGVLHFLTGSEEEVPIGGGPNVDIDHARQLRDGTLEALRSAKSTRWPANSELLLDCAVVISLIFGSNEELLDLIADFAESRAGDHSVQVALAHIAAIEGDYKTAISALKKIPAPARDDSARLVLLLGETGDHHGAVSVAMERLLSQPHDELADLAAVTAAVSAYRLGSLNEESALRNYVYEGSQTGKSLLDFFDGNRKEPENRPAHIERLWSQAMEGEGNRTLQHNLFLYLRPDREGDVDRILNLCELTQKWRGLAEMESAKYAAALLYRKQYEDVLRFTEQAVGLFYKNEDIGLIRAIALDHQGQSAAAEALLRKFAGSSRRDLLQTHSTMLLRVGEVETAIAIVKKALANATDKNDRFHFQRSLALLYGKLDPERHIEAVWRLGEVVDQTVESEEGTFLADFALASLGATTKLDESRIKEFHKRVQNFSERYPESGHFRVGTLPEGGSASDFLAQLNAMLGLDEKTARSYRRLRTLGEQSGSHIPLALRPRGLAPYATNVVDLLRVCIIGVYEGESSKIFVGDPSVGRSDFQSPPILDLVTLVALVELDLFERLFSLWTAIGVPKASLQMLSDLSLQQLSDGSSQLVAKAVEAIRRHRTQIVQPGPQQASRESFPNAEHSVIAAELRAGRFDFLSLDTAAAFFVENEAGVAGRCRCIWDFLRHAEMKGSLHAETSRLVRLRVASWNTSGVPLEAADVAAAARGAVLDDAPGRVDATAVRAARRYLTQVAGVEAVKRAAKTIVAIALSGDVRREAAIGWFAKVCFREFVLARSANLTDPPDQLTSHLLAFVAIDVCGSENGVELMQPVWRALDSARIDFGGTQNKDDFLCLLGDFTAIMFGEIVSKIGVSAMGQEAEYRELLFSGVTRGTHDRDLVEEAYFRRTSQLQKN
jgi:tetratricopeptide (TPR) repeat protein